MLEASWEEMPGNGMMLSVLQEGRIKTNIKHPVASDTCVVGGENPQVFNPTWATDGRALQFDPGNHLRRGGREILRAC